MQYDPVCGNDGITYGNACTATAAGKTIVSAGECKVGTELEQALKFAYQFGITKYTNLNDFKSESAVTREQISKMILQFAKAVSHTSSK
jgi:Kazal-type serine protease inhibitor domain